MVVSGGDGSSHIYLSTVHMYVHVCIHTYVYVCVRIYVCSVVGWIPYMAGPYASNLAGRLSARFESLPCHQEYCN
jgi:hypothetical protein